MVFAISLALLEGNLVLLFWAGGNVARERKGRQEKKKTKGLGGWRSQRELHGKRAKRRGATRGFPRRSPILVLLSPNHI